MVYKKFIIPVVIVGLTVAEFLVFIFASTTVQDSQFRGNISYDPPALLTGPLLQGQSLTQYFTAEENGLKKIDIFFATYGRENTAELRLQLLQNGEVVSSELIDQRDIKDNSFYVFDIPEQENSAGETYLLSLSSPNGTDTTSVTTRYSGVTLEGSAFYLNGNPVNGTVFIIPGYAITWGQYVIQAAQRIALNKGNVLPWPGVLVLGALAVLGLNLAVAWSIFPPKLESRR